MIRNNKTGLIVKKTPVSTKYLIQTSVHESWLVDVMCMCVFVCYRMKMTLAEFLSSHSVDIRQCCLLLLQVVEAVVHLNNHNMSCKYMKHTRSTNGQLLLFIRIS